MSFSRHHSGESDRKQVAYETDAIVRKGEYSYSSYAQNCLIYRNIKEIIGKSCEDTMLFDKDEMYFFNDSQTYQKDHGEMCMFETTNESTFSAAKRIKDQFKIKETVVLNFASAIKPGGGYKNGKQAQEETLSRQSALVSTLTQRQCQKFYEFHRKMENEKDFYYSDYMIYSPNVPVFRDESEQLINYYRVSVITSAAVNIQKMRKFNQPVNNEYIRNAMKQRIRKIIQAAIVKNSKALVVGAFGCGVFENNPQDVSQIFKEVLIDEKFGNCFKIVVFAIKNGQQTIINQFLRFFQGK